MRKEKSGKHPWRLCPSGQHWVRPYERRPTENSKHPGKMIPVRGHCANNPSHRDVIRPEEIEAISSRRFRNLKGPPSRNDLGYKDGRTFDAEIRGWTRYWNQVLLPAELLDPNLVKALVASESGFKPKLNTPTPSAGYARGLLQITDETLGVLNDEHGELKDHLFLDLTRKDLDTPTVNICAGIRWLFEKKNLASAILKREATWEEGVANYKGCLHRNTPMCKRGMARFAKCYRQLQEEK